MDQEQELIANKLSTLGEELNSLTVRLSNELVQLLSDQLYNSPFKAIEELVVNAYDADSLECRVYVPKPSDQSYQFIAIFDNGIGMDYDGLVNLWQIGRSNKRDEEVSRRSKRKQIGKFGIGKLASYTIATRMTYISKVKNDVLSVTLDFKRFTETTLQEPVILTVRKISNLSEIAKDNTFKDICNVLGIDLEIIIGEEQTSWTLCLLEDLKPKAKLITYGRLKWILTAAMPFQTGFSLYLNKEKIERTKEAFKPISEFSLIELPPERLQSLQKSTGEEWKILNNKLISASFKDGIEGNVLITEESLTGKSDDLARSHGFFIRARGRLLNEVDEYFGITQSSYETFAHFRADIEADDLDSIITAPREGIEQSDLRNIFVKFLNEIFYEARSKYQKWKDEDTKKEITKKEGIRNYVAPWLFERPIADALVDQGRNLNGAEANESWFYLDLLPDSDVKNIIDILYNKPRTKYEYKYTGGGSSARIAKFDLATFSFAINGDHAFVRSHSDDPRSKILLEQIVTAEVMLEVSLRQNKVLPHIIGEILEQRDLFLRSLAKDHPYSLKEIAINLRDAAANEYDLEVEMIAAARALGFVATHIGGPGEPDGLARFVSYPGGEQKITLEAKSSIGIPNLSQLDFGGLKEHITKSKAEGCLLIAPAYPGQTRDNNAVANRANESKISCWTIEQLARLVESAESRHITANSILKIVLSKFSPDDVSIAIDELFAQPKWDIRDLYKVILDALRYMENKLPDSPRNVDMIATVIATKWTEFEQIEKTEIEKAVENLAKASQGLLTLSVGTIILHGSLDEIERRVSGLTKDSGVPRRPSTFRNGLDE